MPPLSVKPSNFDVHCPACFSCVDDAIEQCPRCEKGRPDDGWPPLRDAPYPFLGRVIDDRYLVDRFLDSGAAGHVYRAAGLHFNRHFALKIVDARRFDDPEVRREVITRFHREVDTLSQITNPHVVDVFEALALDDAIFGLVMGYVDGQTLESLLDQRGRLTIDNALGIGLQIANGLHEAHRRGIVHRDLKPENVMVETLPASGLFARILDFGIAHAGDVEEDYGFQGTPLYASPEQCTQNRPPDARSDIYSLGCLLYHLLTGRPPFPYTNALRVMDAHIKAPRPRLSDATDGVDFPQGLEYLIGHLMACDPDERPQSLDLVHRDLKALAGDETPRHFDAPPTYRDEEFEEFSDDGLDAITPPPEQVTSLGEHTSSQLADDPTATDDGIPRWNPEVDVEMNLVDDRRLRQIDGATLTASALDRQGMACLIADSTPAVHIISRGDDGFEQTFSHDRLISAVDLALTNGLFLLADTGGYLVEFEPGTGRSTGKHLLSSSALALESLPAARRIYFGTERGRLHLFDLRTETEHEITRFHHAVSAIHRSPDGSILVGLWDGSVVLLDGDQPKWQRPVTPDAVADIGNFDDDHFFAVDARGTIYLGALSDGHPTEHHEIGPGLRTVRHLDDGRLMSVSLFDDQLQFWSVDVQ